MYYAIRRALVEQLIWACRVVESGGPFVVINKTTGHHLVLGAEAVFAYASLSPGPQRPSHRYEYADPDLIGRCIKWLTSYDEITSPA